MADHIKKLLASITADTGNWKQLLIRNWPDIIGNLKEHVTLEKVERDTVTLGTFDACWMQELYLLTPTLLRVINESLDQPYIKQVRFKMVGIKKKQPTRPQERATPKIIPRALNPREQQALDNIEDDTLRQALQSFRIRCYQENKK